MAYRSKIIKEWVDVTVSAPNQVFKASFEVDKHAAVILGIALTSSFEEKVFYRGSQKITINEKEIYPEGYESKMLMHGLNVPVKDRIIGFDEVMLPGNRRVDIEYRDTEHINAPFGVYRVRLYVFSRIDE